MDALNFIVKRICNLIRTSEKIIISQNGKRYRQFYTIAIGIKFKKTIDNLDNVEINCSKFLMQYDLLPWTVRTVDNSLEACFFEGDNAEILIGISRSSDGDFVAPVLFNEVFLKNLFNFAPFQSKLFEDLLRADHVSRCCFCRRYALTCNDEHYCVRYGQLDDGFAVYYFSVNNNRICKIQAIYLRDESDRTWELHLTANEFVMLYVLLKNVFSRKAKEIFDYHKGLL